MLLILAGAALLLKVGSLRPAARAAASTLFTQCCLRIGVETDSANAETAGFLTGCRRDEFAAQG